LFASLLTCAAHAGSLESNFLHPPDTTKPRCYWYWMDGQITKEGITRDLEAMKRVGIGEGYIGVITGQSGTPNTSASKALTDEWWSFIEHAIREGTRLGVDIGFFNSPGWSQSGGPWVKPSQAMRYVSMPFLPVMTGRIVGSADQSDRFLWDLRRLVADRMGRDYVGGLSDLCHEHGLKMWLENYGHWGFPAEFLQYGSLCDEIAGEFWADGDFLNTKDTPLIPAGLLGPVCLRDANTTEIR